MSTPSAEDRWLHLEESNPDLTKTLRADPLPAGAAVVPEDGLSVGQILGEGGMGVVAVGDQGRLRRQVAVKRLKPDAPEEIGHTLLREAWVTGALEHPNIVPVHDLLADENGRPQIVLKRIEGTEWEDLIDGKVPLPEEAVDDPIAWHLRVLMQVCNAVEFAHGQGVVHRDLKPENVMVGAFGEVYVLDWGIAIGLRPDPRGRFPLLEDQKRMVGTPVYMPPEMFQSDTSRLGPGTDVYLLAGMLYRVLAGRPPHQGDDLRALARSAKKLPPLDDSWPADLRELLTQAMARDPKSRPGAGAFRRALVTHLDRRSLEGLYQHAVERFDELRGLLAEDTDDPQHPIAIHDAVGAARFGLKEVVSSWPEHPSASAVLRELHLTMVDYELGRGNGPAARMWLTRVEAPPEGLDERVEAEIARAAEDRERLERLSEDLSRGTGLFARLLMLALLGAAWVGFPLVAELAGWGVDHLRSAVQYTLVLGGLMLSVVVLWRSIRSSRTNRGFVTLAMLSTVFTLLVVLMGWWTDAPIEQTLLLKTVCDALLACVAALLFELLMLPSALFYVLMVVVGVLAPEWAYAAGRLATFILVLNGLVAWPFFGTTQR